MTSVASAGSSAASAWKESGIIGNVIKGQTQAPPHITEMVYNGKLNVELGNKFTPEQTQATPNITYPADESRLYTILFFDPDAPSRDDPKMGPWCHWVVTNIKGSQVTKGETLVPYQGPAPPAGTGYHRYIMTVWEQGEPLEGAAVKLKTMGISTTHRACFNFQQWLNQYSPPPKLISGNFFLAQNSKDEQKD